MPFTLKQNTNIKFIGYYLQNVIHYESKCPKKTKSEYEKEEQEKKQKEEQNKKQTYRYVPFNLVKQFFRTI